MDYGQMRPVPRSGIISLGVVQLSGIGQGGRPVSWVKRSARDAVLYLQYAARSISSVH